MSDNIQELRQQVAELKAALDKIAREQDVHFTRIAQLQADIDLIRAAWVNVKPPDTAVANIGERRKADG